MTGDLDTPDTLADFIRDQVCCPRAQGCEVNGTDECPAEQVRNLGRMLKDANTLHLNMLRGGLPKLAPAHIGHLYRGGEALAVIAEVARQNGLVVTVAATPPG